jgi:hypothetical protein
VALPHTPAAGRPAALNTREAVSRWLQVGALTCIDWSHHTHTYTRTTPSCLLCSASSSVAVNPLDQLSASARVCFLMQRTATPHAVSNTAADVASDVFQLLCCRNLVKACEGVCVCGIDTRHVHVDAFARG